MHRDDAMKSVVERYLLDRRRVEAAHFQYAVLRVASWYPDVLDITQLPLHSHADNTLTSVFSVWGFYDT